VLLSLLGRGLSIIELLFGSVVKSANLRHYFFNPPVCIEFDASVAMIDQTF
jgi:hypothetical protein